MNLPAPEICQRLLALHRDLGQSADHLDPLLALLAANGLTWGDLPALFAQLGMEVTSPPPKALGRTVCSLHAAMGRASTLGQRQKARDALVKRLAEEGLSWQIDLPAIIAGWLSRHPADQSPAAPVLEEGVSLLDVVARVIERRVVLTKAQRTVAALWVLNCHVFDNHPHAPQLGVLAPASGCGKSTLRRLLGGLARSAWHSHGTSPAAIYRAIDRNPRTAIMLDEVENID